LVLTMGATRTVVGVGPNELVGGGLVLSKPKLDELKEDELS
jgi:hypothetical protein